MQKLQYNFVTIPNWSIVWKVWIGKTAKMRGSYIIYTIMLNARRRCVELVATISSPQHTKSRVLFFQSPFSTVVLKKHKCALVQRWRVDKFIALTQCFSTQLLFFQSLFLISGLSARRPFFWDHLSTRRKLKDFDLITFYNSATYLL